MERERRYPSDLADAQWEIVERMLPLIKSPGRIPKHPRRAIVDAILYVVRTVIRLDRCVGELHHMLVSVLPGLL